jgi:hypothetical protein
MTGFTDKPLLFIIGAGADFWSPAQKYNLSHSCSAGLLPNNRFGECAGPFWRISYDFRIQVTAANQHRRRHVFIKGENHVGQNPSITGGRVARC